MYAEFDGTRIVFREISAKRAKCIRERHMDDPKNVSKRYDKRYGCTYDVCLECHRQTNRAYQRRRREA